MSEAITEVLLQDIASNACDGKLSLLLQLVEQCLLQLGSSEENIGKILDTKLCHILTQFAKNVEQQWLKVDLLSKLGDKLNILLAELKKGPRNNFGNIFTEKMNIIEFNEKLSDFMSYNVEGQKMTIKPAPNNLAAQFAEETVKHSSQELVKAILCLVSCINHIITIEWKSLFTWQLTDLGNEVIEEVKDTNCHDGLFSLYTACKSLQTWVVDKDLPSYNELQVVTDVLEPYLQQHATPEKMSCTKDTSSGQNVGNESIDIVGEIGKICLHFTQKYIWGSQIFCSFLHHIPYPLTTPFLL